MAGPLVFGGLSASASPFRFEVWTSPAGSAGRERRQEKWSWIICRFLSTFAAPGTQPYPLPCLRFTDAESAWFHLDQLHQTNTPYNLIYSQGCLHCIDRVPQDSTQLSDAIRGYGWSEMAGGVTLFSREAFDRLSAAEFEAALANFAPRSG